MIPAGIVPPDRGSGDRAERTKGQRAQVDAQRIDGARQETAGDVPRRLPKRYSEGRVAACGHSACFHRIGKLIVPGGIARQVVHQRRPADA